MPASCPCVAVSDRDFAAAHALAATYGLDADAVYLVQWQVAPVDGDTIDTLLAKVRLRAVHRHCGRRAHSVLTKHVPVARPRTPSPRSATASSCSNAAWSASQAHPRALTCCSTMASA